MTGHCVVKSVVRMDIDLDKATTRFVSFCIPSLVMKARGKDATTPAFCTALVENSWLLHDGTQTDLAGMVLRRNSTVVAASRFFIGREVLLGEC